MERQTYGMLGPVLSTIPLVHLFVQGVTVRPKFAAMFHEMGVEMPVITTWAILWPVWPWIVLGWIIVGLALAAAVPATRRAIFHLNLWPGMLLVVLLTWTLFLPLLKMMEQLGQQGP